MLVDRIATAWMPLARTSEVADRPTRVEAAGRLLVLFRNNEGDAVALDARCPHRGTLLDLGDVVDGTIRCPYHGWRFGDGGVCVDIPSLAGSVPKGCHTTAWRTTERDGLVWGSADLAADPEAVPGFVDAASIGPGMRLIVGDPIDWATSAGRVVENMLDVGHFPFVHTTTFGCPEAEVVAPHTPQARDGLLTCAIDVTTANPQTVQGPLYPGLGPTIVLHYRYEVRLPYRVTLAFTFPDGMHRVLHEVVTPTSASTCRMYWALGVDERLGSIDEDELAFARSVFAEDRPVVESQPPGVPLHPSAEVHVPADRLAVAYRRALRDWGVPEEARI